MQRYGRYASANWGLNGNPVSNCWPVLSLHVIVLFVLLFFVVLFFSLLRLFRAATEEKQNATPFIFLIFSSHSCRFWRGFENDINIAIDKFYCTVHEKFKNSFPSIRVKMSSKDPSFMSPLLKHLLSKRNKLLRKGMVQEAGSLQPKITQLIKENQLNLTKVNKQKPMKWAANLGGRWLIN